MTTLDRLFMEEYRPAYDRLTAQLASSRSGADCLQAYEAYCTAKDRLVREYSSCSVSLVKDLYFRYGSRGTIVVERGRDGIQDRFLRALQMPEVVESSLKNYLLCGAKSGVSTESEKQKKIVHPVGDETGADPMERLLATKITAASLIENSEFRVVQRMARKQLTSCLRWRIRSIENPTNKLVLQLTLMKKLYPDNWRAKALFTEKGIAEILAAKRGVKLSIGSIGSIVSREISKIRSEYLPDYMNYRNLKRVRG